MNNIDTPCDQIIYSDGGDRIDDLIPKAETLRDGTMKELVQACYNNGEQCFNITQVRHKSELGQNKCVMFHHNDRGSWIDIPVNNGSGYVNMQIDRSIASVTS
jgi:hypothetical protein